ncbi:hypothetical protein ACF07Z_28650 [Streptomyces albidoflavus]
MAAAQLIQASASVLAWPGGTASTRVRVTLTYSVGRVALHHAASLRFKMPDTVPLDIPDLCFFHGGFPADALVPYRFDLVQASAFGGFAAE